VTTTDHLPATTLVRASSPAELLAVIPHLLGFQPEASLIVIGTSSPRDKIRVTLRYDLPDPSGQGVSAEIAEHAASVLNSQRLTRAVAVAYGPEAAAHPVLTALLSTFSDEGIDLHDTIRADGGRYWGWTCRNDGCCPPEGTPYDTTAPPAGLQGEVLEGRAALAATIAPVHGAAAEAMRAATRRAEQRADPLLVKGRQNTPLAAVRRMIAAEGLAAAGTMIARYRNGGAGFIPDDAAARVTVALRDLRVRDDAWARMDPAHTDAHVRMWTELTRRAQPGYVAGPAALLAFTAWQSGHGALANVALDRALADQPRYSMALLLRQVITAGAPPSLARLPMTPEEVAASYDGLDAGDDTSG
jgi:hypothetical protein